MASVTVPDKLTVEELLLLSEARSLAASGRGRQIREAAGVSQAELGAAIDTAVPTVSKWETGQRRPTGRAAIEYARLMRAIGKHLNENRSAGDGPVREGDRGSGPETG